MSPTRPRCWLPLARSARRVAGPVLELAADEFRRQMDVNVIGSIIATQAFGPSLGSDPSLRGKPGQIVMISSVAGKNGNPLMSAYSASKHAIEGLSESLRREMMLFGIDVIIIAPGAVKTPIWSKVEEIDISAYKNSPFFPALERIRKFMLHLGETGLPAEKIAEAIATALTSAHPKVRYQLTPDPMQHLITAVLPKRMGRQDHRQAYWVDAAGMRRMMRAPTGPLARSLTTPVQTVVATWQALVRRCSKRLDYSRKDITNAALRLDYAWRIRVDLELASQTQDLDIDASVENVLADSRCLEKHLSRERPLWRFEKREQQGIFGFGHQNRRAVRIDEATGATFKRPAVKPVPAPLRVAGSRCAATFVPP